jgi:hypothetical protein
MTGTLLFSVGHYKHRNLILKTPQPESMKTAKFFTFLHLPCPKWGGFLVAGLRVLMEMDENIERGGY